MFKTLLLKLKRQSPKVQPPVVDENVKRDEELDLLDRTYGC